MIKEQFEKYFHVPRQKPGWPVLAVAGGLTAIASALYLPLGLIGLAGFIYLAFFYASFKQFRYVKLRVDDFSTLGYINLACGAGLIGYFVGAFFLDLIIFEPFYFLMVLMTANYHLVKQKDIEVISKDKRTKLRVGESTMKRQSAVGQRVEHGL